MNWFNLLKNQIASNKGKQFQLDFTQPMIEEDDNCKKKLLDLAKRALNVDSIEGYPFKKKSNLGFNFIHKEENTKYTVETNRIEFFIKKDGLKKVPEEVCCMAIKLYKSLGDNQLKEEFLLGYKILCAKNYAYAGKNISHYDTVIEIHPIKDKINYYIVNITSSTGLNTPSSEKPKEMSEKLTRELFVL